MRGRSLPGHRHRSAPGAVWQGLRVSRSPGTLPKLQRNGSESKMVGVTPPAPQLNPHHICCDSAAVSVTFPVIDIVLLQVLAPL